VTRRAHDLVDEHDLEPELLEGVLWRHGADIDVPDLDGLDGAGVVARTAERRPRYAASFFDPLWAVGPLFTAAAVDRFCSASGPDKRAVYYHLLDAADLELDLRR
jgi:hypothetical protein